MKTKKTVYYILMYLPLAAALLALPQLPEKIPAHFGFDNQVDRWGSKYEALLFPVISLLMGYFLLGMAKLAAKKEVHGENNKKVTMIMGIFVLILFNALNAYFLYTSLNKVEDLSSVSLDLYQLVFGIMGVLMIVTGNVMPKLRRNAMIGLRTRWSMKNDVTWKKSQLIGGISFIVGGVMIIGICIAVKGIFCPVSVFGVWGIMIVVDVVLTYRVARRYG